MKKANKKGTPVGCEEAKVFASARPFEVVYKRSEIKYPKGVLLL